MYSLPEVLLLVVCATIARCNDYDKIVAWGEAQRSIKTRRKLAGSDTDYLHSLISPSPG